MPLILFLVIGLMVGAVATYLLLMVYFPEWVGITGKAAHQHLKQHESGSKAEDPAGFN